MQILLPIVQLASPGPGPAMVVPGPILPKGDFARLLARQTDTGSVSDMPPDAGLMVEADPSFLPQNAETTGEKIVHSQDDTPDRRSGDDLLITLPCDLCGRAAGSGRSETPDPAFSRPAQVGEAALPAVVAEDRPSRLIVAEPAEGTAGGSRMSVVSGTGADVVARDEEPSRPIPWKESRMATPGSGHRQEIFVLPQDLVRGTPDGPGGAGAATMAPLLMPAPQNSADRTSGASDLAIDLWKTGSHRGEHGGYSGKAPPGAQSFRHGPDSEAAPALAALLRAETVRTIASLPPGMGGSAAPESGTQPASGTAFATPRATYGVVAAPGWGSASAAIPAIPAMVPGSATASGSVDPKAAGTSAADMAPRISPQLEPRESTAEKTTGHRADRVSAEAMQVAVAPGGGPPISDEGPGPIAFVPTDGETLVSGPVGLDGARSTYVQRGMASSSVHASPLLQQMVAAVQSAGAGVTEIRLEPVELGRVTLTLSTYETGITVMVATDRPETADLIRRHLDTLLAEFRQLGYGSVSYSFTNSGSGPASDRSQAVTTGDDDDSDPATEDPRALGARAPHRAAGDGTLDIRM